MELLREEKDELNAEEISKWIEKYEESYVPEMVKKQRYSKGDNPFITDKPKKDANNPDNKVRLSYGRKLITTFTGYGYRPGYITYNTDDEMNKAYYELLMKDFEKNNEHIKTSKNGKQTGIYGVSYELIYLDGDSENADIRFVPIKPQELILLYDYQAEPEAKIAIRIVPMSALKQEITVYYADRIESYLREREYEGAYAWKITKLKDEPNFFGEIPIIAYYLDDDSEGIIWPVKDLINMLDTLISGNMDEFERFANSYLRIVGISLEDPIKTKGPNQVIDALQRIRKRRVFERLKSKDDVTFLTKDLPTEFLKMMYDILKEQIHEQSHIPDLDERELSGIAVQRMMFNFENVISTAEARFDEGLYKRIELMNKIYAIRGENIADPSVIDISHKRNAPLNLKEFAETALIMKQGGFSREAILLNMPTDMIPDKEMELERQNKETESMFDVTMFNRGNEEDAGSAEA